ncbi:hypothetical protein [Listeria booriae]|uniref:hypothetical protein n=1 Tax=Listeria booriae TaxID=1552123 RepID=UPI0016265416|nr:hypothetical protein [Listeria booriae]MBC1247238.1 hypothetical protein [Listeria booriae]MBC6300897.1 hypothetical protein [Listeria booriae]
MKTLLCDVFKRFFHAWVSDKLDGTNHQDPIAWLKNGVLMTQLEKDLKARY